MHLFERGNAMARKDGRSMQVVTFRIRLKNAFKAFYKELTGKPLKRNTITFGVELDGMEEVRNLAKEVNELLIELKARSKNITIKFKRKYIE